MKAVGLTLNDTNKTKHSFPMSSRQHTTHMLKMDAMKNNKIVVAMATETINSLSARPNIFLIMLKHVLYITDSVNIFISETW